MLARFISLGGIIAAIILLFFVSSSTPVSAGPLGILVVFLCLYVLLLCSLTLFLWGLHRLIAKLLAPFTVRRPIRPVSLQRSYYFSSILALGPVMLVGMQSVGGIGPYEFGLVVLFVVIGCVYIAKRTT